MLFLRALTRKAEIYIVSSVPYMALRSIFFLYFLYFHELYFWLFEKSFFLWWQIACGSLLKVKFCAFICRVQNISVHCSLLINWIYPTIYIKYEVSIPNYSKINTETGILLEHLAFLLENRAHSSYWLLIFLGSRSYNTKATHFRCHSGYFFCLARNASFSRGENRIGVSKKRCDRTMAKCQVTVWCGTREERRLDFQVHNCRLSFD